MAYDSCNARCYLTLVLNGTLESAFRNRHKGFRPVAVQTHQVWVSVTRRPQHCTLSNTDEFGSALAVSEKIGARQRRPQGNSHELYLVQSGP